MNFGEKIRLAREAAKYTQAELAAISGIAKRTIQNYESGERMPKKREIYARLANVLNIEESVLLDDTAEFVLKAQAELGARASRQAEQLVEEVRGLYSGGNLADEDMDAMMKAIQDAYWIAKKKNRKFVPLKYRAAEEE
jgi:transcriptional regulator with XRE-family HTH domain